MLSQNNGNFIMNMMVHVFIQVYTRYIIGMALYMFGFDLLFNLLRIALWPSVAKELSPWLFTSAVFIFVPS